MGILAFGLLLFFGIHLLPTVPSARNRLYGTLGEKRYKGLFSIVSALGLVLIIVGFAHAPDGPQLFAPFPGAVHAARLVVPLSFILFASANMRTHIRRSLRHPMLIGLILWSGVHLLANGEAKATLLFGAFLAYAVVDLVSATRRGAIKTFTPVARQDVMAIASGLLLALLVMTFHRPLFGVAVVGWGM